MGKFVDLSSQVFGNLKVISLSDRISKNGNRYWECECLLYGTKKAIRSTGLRFGNYSSCGCKRGKHSLKHGYSSGGHNHKLYDVWYAMKHRCININNPEYHRYGGRGVSICKEWLDPKIFIEWCLANGYQEGLSIDRINNDGDYTPNNCRFTTQIVQAQNFGVSSKSKTGVKGVSWHSQCDKWRAYITLNGKQKSLGLFTSIEDASNARALAEKNYGWREETAVR